MSHSYDRQARDFPTQEALKEYLREHPEADRSKHKVEPSESKKDGPKDPREYARERAKFAPPKKKDQFVGVPSMRAASALVRRVLTRFLGLPPDAL